MELSQIWFPYTHSEGNYRSKNVFCFHHAGGSGTNFTKWNQFSDGIHFIPIEMPGRGVRMGEQCCDCFANIIEEMTEAVKEEIEKLSSEDFVFYGHSMGAIIAFCVASCLEKKYNIAPKALFVAARHAPQMPDPSLFKSNMPDESLITEMKRLGGTPSEILNCKEYLSLFLKIIRNDYKLHEDFHYTGEKINVPIIAHSGQKDDGASIVDMTQWACVTNSNCIVEEFTGGHFFPYELGENYVKHLIDEVGLVDA